MEQHTIRPFITVHQGDQRPSNRVIYAALPGWGYVGKSVCATAGENIMVPKFRTVNQRELYFKNNKLFFYATTGNIRSAVVFKFRDGFWS